MSDCKVHTHLGPKACERFLEACDTSEVSQEQLLEITRLISKNLYGYAERYIKQNKYKGRNTVRAILQHWRETSGVNCCKGKSDEFSMERLITILGHPNVRLIALSEELQQLSNNEIDQEDESEQQASVPRNDIIQESSSLSEISSEISSIPSENHRLLATSEKIDTPSATINKDNNHISLVQSSSSIASYYSIPQRESFSISMKSSSTSPLPMENGMVHDEDTTTTSCSISLENCSTPLTTENKVVHDKDLKSDSCSFSMENSSLQLPPETHHLLRDEGCGHTADHPNSNKSASSSICSLASTALCGITQSENSSMFIEKVSYSKQSYSSVHSLEEANISIGNDLTNEHNQQSLTKSTLTPKYSPTWVFIAILSILTGLGLIVGISVLIALHLQPLNSGITSPVYPHPIENHTAAFKNCTAAEILVLIGGENREEELLQSVEVVIYPSHCGTSEQFPQLPKITSNPVAGYLNNSLITCGGCENPYSCGIQTNCYILNLQDMEQGWTEFTSLNEPRMYSASFQSPNGEMFITGGASPDVMAYNGRDSVEFIKGINHTWELGNPLTSPITHHCIATIGTKAYLTGGKPNGAGLSSFDFDDNQWMKHGEFLNKRYDHSCMGFEIEGSEFILVEGGLTENGKCARTELYDLGQNKSTDHDHIYCREGASLVQVNGKILLVGGAVTTGDIPYYPKEIYEFNKNRWLNDRTVEWTLIPYMKLDIGRSGLALVVIPIRLLKNS